MTRIVATADIHGTLPEIPECDILLIAGDVCPIHDHERNYQANWLRGPFREWMLEVPAKEVVWTGGNHDFTLQYMARHKINALPGFYLDNESVEVMGLKIWGSPYSPAFGSWAHMKTDAELAPMWAMIPHDVDILMIHGPIYGYQDQVNNDWHPEDDHVGSKTLRNRLEYGDYPNLKLFVTGHIHEGYGLFPQARLGKNKFDIVNASLMGEEYEPSNAIWEFDV